MTTRERSKWYLLTGIRATLSILDLLGILAIGFVVTSTAIFLTQGSSPDRVLEFAGFQIRAVNAQTLPGVAGAVLATFLLKAFLSVLITRKAAHFVANIEARAAKVIAERVFGGDLAQARLKSPEQMAYAIQFGSPAAFNYLLNYTSTVVAEGSLFILICLGFLLVDPLATAAAVAYFALIALVIQHFVGTLMSKAGTQGAQATLDANKAVGDLVAVFRELSVLRVKHKFIDVIYQSRVSAAHGAATQTYLNGMPRYILESALLVGVAGFILFESVGGDILSSAATVGVFLSGGFRLTAAMLPLQAALLSIKGHLPVATKAHEILFGPSSPTNESIWKRCDTDRLGHLMSAAPVKLEFNNVWFEYAGATESAIRGVSLTVEPGSKVAFIGPSGAGKSTLADLMCGVLTPSSGEILVESLAVESKTSQRHAIAYVPQKPGLVSGSLAQNVALGIEKHDIDETQVWAALERANLRDLVSSLPDGLHTNLGNYRDGLSGGQIQRLGLARALYSRPGLLVMDEATSALDAESEGEIAMALDQMRGKVTVVLIAHRLNTVQHADKVFLIGNGQLLDQGTFQELVERNTSVERLVALMKVVE